MVATRLLDLVLLLSKEDSLVTQKYNFFVLPSDNWWSVFVFQRDASTMQVCWLTRGFLLIVQRFAISPTGQPMCIYGDPAYPLMVHLQAPFRQGRLTPQMQAYNDAMSEVRISVEWLFGDIINSFKFLDYKKKLKIELSSVGKMYVVCALLWNAITCLYKNQTSLFFELDPPIPQEYFQ